MNKLLSFCFLTLPALLLAQEVEMADGLRSSGKIYVVVVVIAIVLAGLFGYLFYLDNKISKQEKLSGK